MNTFIKAKQFIENCKDKTGLYQGVTSILASDMAHYPEDWQVKQLQRLADAKYEQLETETRNIVESLSADALEIAYRKRQMQYLIQDAKNHTEDYLCDEFELEGQEIPEIPEEVYEAMAKEFLDRQDCNIPENDVWEGVVRDFLHDEAYANSVQNKEYNPFRELEQLLNCPLFADSLFFKKGDFDE